MHPCTTTSPRRHRRAAAPTTAAALLLGTCLSTIPASAVPVLPRSTSGTVRTAVVPEVEDPGSLAALDVGRPCYLERGAWSVPLDGFRPVC